MGRSLPLRVPERKPRTIDETATAMARAPGGTPGGRSDEVSSILRLQRTIGNQAARRWSAVAPHVLQRQPKPTSRPQPLRYDRTAHHLAPVSPAQTVANLK